MPRPDATEIMREERERTLAEIDKLPLSPEARADVLRVCAAIQQALNDTLQELDRAIDPRVGVADKVLRYRPKPKSQPAKKRQRKRRKIEKAKAND